MMEPDDAFELFEERAGILEFEGEMNRDEAEAKAWQEIFGTPPQLQPGRG